MIENNASQGRVYHIWNDQRQQADYGSANISNHQSLSFFVPYFGMFIFHSKEKCSPRTPKRRV